MALAPFVAEQLFGEDGYINPMVPHPFIKFDLYDFIMALLPVIRNSAVAST